MNVFDRLIDNFSAKDLKSRVTGVMILGFAICAIAGAGLAYLLMTSQEISISGVGRMAEESGGNVVVSLDQEQLGLLGDREMVSARFMDPAKGPATIEARVVSINPSAPSVLLAAPGLPGEFTALERFDVELVLFSMPLWKMLWGPK